MNLYCQVSVECRKGVLARLYMSGGGVRAGSKKAKLDVSIILYLYLWSKSNPHT